MGCLDVVEAVLNERSSVQKQKEGSGNYSYRRPVCSHHPLRSARLYRCGGRVKAADEGEPRDRIWEIVDVDTAGRQLITQLRRFFAHFVIFKVQLLFHKRRLHLFLTLYLSTFLCFF